MLFTYFKENKCKRAVVTNLGKFSVAFLTREKLNLYVFAHRKVKQAKAGFSPQIIKKHIIV